MHCILFFALCGYITAANSQPTLTGVSNDVTALKSDIASLQKKLKTLEDESAVKSTYCGLHSNGNCGSCVCIDDFDLPEKYYCDCQNLVAKRDCLAFYQSGLRVNGIYKVTMSGFRTTQVYCDQTSYGGGWTVIQRRMDGSTNFYRSWEEYKNGFGKLHKEFWLGNDNIHLLTLQALFPKGSEALIRITQHQNSNSYWINRYSHFQVDNEKSKYMLHVSGASGGYSSYLTSYNDKREFSTYDQDNDKTSSYHCARDRNLGGWWYNQGNGYTNLNGPYDTYVTRSYYQSFDWGGYRLKHSEIKVRRL